jgi:hypothetical protein
MVVLTVSSITYFVLIVLAPIALWKNANRLNEILAFRKQLQRSAKRARVAPEDPGKHSNRPV